MDNYARENSPANPPDLETAFLRWGGLGLATIGVPLAFAALPIGFGLAVIGFGLAGWSESRTILDAHNARIEEVAVNAAKNRRDALLTIL